MSRVSRSHLAGIRGGTRLLADAAGGVVDIVERMHRTIQRTPAPVGKAVDERTSGLTGLIYGSIRGGVWLAGRGLDLALAPVEGLLPHSGTDAEGRLNPVLNGIYGDHLARTGNPLAIEMHFRHGGRRLDAGDLRPRFDGASGAAASRRLLIMVHGLCMSAERWEREGVNRSALLAERLDATAVYVAYNSGLKVAANGSRLAELLEDLVAGWPVPVEEITLLGHSMGGLVARAACHVAEERGHGWIDTRLRLAFLGTPHLGAPLERGGHGIDRALGISPYSAPFTRIGGSRSAGIQDLRHGAIAEDGRTVPLPDGVEAYAIAATLGERDDPVARKLVGDGLVPLDSALGRHRDGARALTFEDGKCWISYRTGHIELLYRPEPFEQLGRWLGA